VVAASYGTQKVREASRYANQLDARKNPYVHIVTPHWLLCCAERWDWVDERLFKLNETHSGVDSGYRNSPEPNSRPPGRGARSEFGEGRKNGGVGRKTSGAVSGSNGSGKGKDGSAEPWTNDRLTEAVGSAQLSFEMMAEVDEAMSDTDDSSDPDEVKDGRGQSLRDKEERHEAAVRRRLANKAIRAAAADKRRDDELRAKVLKRKRVEDSDSDVSLSGNRRKNVNKGVTDNDCETPEDVGNCWKDDSLSGEEDKYCGNSSDDNGGDDSIGSDDAKLAAEVEKQILT